MKDFYVDMYGNAAPSGAQYFDTFWKQFLKVEDGALYVNERGHWSRSQHKDGVSMLDNGECVKLGEKEGAPC